MRLNEFARVRFLHLQTIPTSSGWVMCDVWGTRNHIATLFLARPSRNWALVCDEHPSRRRTARSSKSPSTVLNCLRFPSTAEMKTSSSQIWKMLAVIKLFSAEKILRLSREKPRSNNHELMVLVFVRMVGITVVPSSAMQATSVHLLDERGTPT